MGKRRRKRDNDYRSLPCIPPRVCTCRVRSTSTTIICFFSVMFFFFAGVLCGGANDTNGIVKCAGLRQGLDDFSVSRTSRPASHRLLESNSTLGANPWLTPFARCHESRPKNNSYNKKDCGVVVVVVVVAPSRNGRHPFDFHLGNCRRCWIASEKKSPGGRPSNKNLFFFPVEL
jgi:hypothetical protein